MFMEHGTSGTDLGQKYEQLFHAYSALLNENEQLRNAATAFHQHSKEQSTEEALRLSNERYLYATKATFDAIWDWDMINDHLYWGEGYEKMFGYSISDRNHIHSFDNIHPDDKSSVFAGIDKLIAGDALNWTGEYRYKRSNGEYAYVQDRAVIIRNDNGKAVRMIGAMQDITTRKNTEKELQEKNLQLKELSRHLQNVREEERRYLAREVHDELGQLAAVVKMDIDWLKIKMPDIQENYAKRITHASSTTNLLINTIRKLASELRPGMLDELGLNASLEWQCKKFMEINAIECLFECFFDDKELGTQVKTALYRICQESLTNVKRHANATRATVGIYENENDLVLTIRDNGRGFDIAQKINTLGLIGMRERCISVDGTLTVESKPNGGTIICATIPKQKNKH